MEIRILGSVELRTTGKSIAAIPEKVRQVLATLAWQPNQLVSDDVVIRNIWGDSPPRNPRAALCTYASRLRQLFREDEEQGRYPLTRHSSGYALEVDPRCIDLHRFRLLVGQARQASRARDHRSALELFDEALYLWGAVPLANIRSSWAETARVGLEHERLAALVDQLRTSLLLGRHMEVIPLLRHVVAQNPLDENLTAMLMVALCRSGRSSEALQAFGVMYERLVEELGIYPGVPLRDLHCKILSEDQSIMQIAWFMA
ncbi:MULTISPECIES: AfsR/SARP family transcriptional regulator [unclassified Streptomyces]|uniref:AfsR/SARP family transcriptional regulator n=1 Tax=unclassified Streptomyces TaxID=2593676 RepID=UPI00081D3DD1|nr:MULTISPECIES: BTAD domain-containing putative transcriptional regulator [unclassified Streptomyces]MYR92450.1 AfsR/SARP family transcriptional regulator [Streptomyces sp. SID4937]SCD34042.1 DNA-binding transcriptional activator of the SARP family [Streptomyces sp. ScaeMP-e83]